VLFGQLSVGLGIDPLEEERAPQETLHHRRPDGLLEPRPQLVPHGLVDDQLLDVIGFGHPGGVVELPYLVKTQLEVRISPLDLCRVDDAPLGRRENLPGREGDDGHPRLFVDIRRDAGHADPEALQIVPVADGPLEPAQDLGVLNHDGERHHLHLQHVPVQLLVELESPTVD
jgi:hypothetical protein